MPSAIQAKTIVVAIDGSDHANKAFDLAADLAATNTAKLIVLHVLPDAPLSEEERHLAAVEYHTDILGTLNTDALLDVRGDPRAVAGLLVQQYGDATRRMRNVLGNSLMEKARANAKTKEVETIETMIEEGNPTARILKIAKDNSADMIVLGSRGISDLKGLMMGSVSHKVSQMAECTCITVK